MVNTSILPIANLFGKAVQEMIQRSCRLHLHQSKTAQFISAIQISEDLGAFVSFHGNYNGLMVMNFEGNAALEIVQESLITLGMPKEEIPSHYTSDDVRSSIGELVNHIIGKARTMVQHEYDLVAHATIPAVVPVTNPIGLIFKTALTEPHPCIRLSYHTPKSHRFHMELTLEPMLFASLNGEK